MELPYVWNYFSPATVLRQLIIRLVKEQEGKKGKSFCSYSVPTHAHINYYKIKQEL